MNMPKGFLDMVENDIKRIDESMDLTNAERVKLFKELDGRYQSCVSNWYRSMYGSNSAETYINYAYMEQKPEFTIDNLKIAKSKLETFRYGMNAISLPNTTTNQINIQNNNSIEINIAFDDVRSQVNDMTSLSEKETEELLQRIDKLEEIINSKDNKKTKWQKVAPILKWLADKSFDAAMIILPLILKLQEQ